MRISAFDTRFQSGFSIVVHVPSDHPFTKRSGDMVYTSVLD
jgi:hypothetical protein